MTMLEAALKCLEWGWCPLPAKPKGKVPLLSWAGFQSRRPGAEEVKKWFGRWPGANVGIVTGPISGLVIVDADGKAGDESLARLFPQIPPTVVSQTGKGLHYFFRHPGFKIPTRARVLDGLDIRGDGGFAVIPPSLHESGRRYSWALTPDEAELAPLPQPVIATLNRKQVSSVLPDWSELLFGVLEGQRNQAAARLAGRFLCRGFTMAETTFWLEKWNTDNKPPLPRTELLNAVRSVAQREAKRLLGYPPRA